MTCQPELLELIQQAIARNGFTSDLQLDAALNTPNKVCRWKKGFFLPSDELMRRLAILAGRDPDECLALLKALDAEKHNQAEAAMAWRGIVKRLAAVTALVPFALLLMSQNQAHAATGGELTSGGSVYYVSQARDTFSGKTVLVSGKTVLVS